MENRQILLSPIDGSNSGETFQCAQGRNQVSYFRCDPSKMVELRKSNCLMEFALSMNHRHGW